MKKERLLFAILSLCVTAFIFSNSLQLGQESAQTSGWVAHFLKRILDPSDRIEYEVFHYAVRKIAHFSEFGALGFCLMGLSHTLVWKRRWRKLGFSAVLSLAVAAVDECIQMLSPGRTPSVKDVAIDCLGAAAGILAMCFILWLIRKVSRNKGNSE